MKKTLYAVASALILAGCGIKGGCDMTGEWTSAPHKTELGEVVCALSLRTDKTCTLRMSPTAEPDAEPLVEHGSWRSTGRASALIRWKGEKPGAEPIAVSLLSSTALTLSGGGDVIEFKKKD